MAGAMKNLNRVRKKMRDGIERLRRAFRAAWQIYNEALRTHRGHAAGKRSRRRLLDTFAPHLFGYAWNQPVRHSLGRFRSIVARPEAGPACR